MNKYTLRPYQEETAKTVLEAIDDGMTRILYCLATGMGKTVIFSDLIDVFLMQEHRVLVMAHRKELIMGAYKTIKDYCNLPEHMIGAEKADWYAPRSAVVVVGSVQTLQGKRLSAVMDWLKPTRMIVDESHRASASSYRKVYSAAGVYDGKCVLIGCTATPIRSDKENLYAETPDGLPVMVDDAKIKAQRPATREECVFERMVSQFDMLYGIDNAYLVEPIGSIVRTTTDLSKVKKTADGDYQESGEDGLAKVLDADTERTSAIVDKWEDVAKDKPTIVFCASVTHAHHAAQEWQERGYTALDVNGETDTNIRTKAFEDFSNGRLQVLTNYGVYLEGTDLPNCACIVHMRPTKWWGLYVQASGRGLRPITGVIDGKHTVQHRRDAIAASVKPRCIIIDCVDIDKRTGGLCTMPNIIGLPSELDLEEIPLLEANAKIKEFEEVKERVLGEKPKTYRDLVARLEWVDLLRKSAHKEADDWAVTDQGFRMIKGVPVGKGYSAELLSPVAGEYKLVVTIKGQEKPILARVSKPGRNFDEYLLAAAKQAQDAIAAHNIVRPKGTLALLTYKQAACLRANGHSDKEIDGFTTGYAKKLINGYMDKWKARQTAQTAAQV